MGRVAELGSLASLSSTSAWHAVPGLHQHARFLPRSSLRLSSIHCFRSAIPAVTPSTVIHVWNAPTARICDRSAVTLNGFPHFDGRETTTVFGGSFAPDFRDSCTRCGLANHALQRTRPLRFDFILSLSWAGSLSLGRWAALHAAPIRLPRSSDTRHRRAWISAAPLHHFRAARFQRAQPMPHPVHF